MKFSQLTRNCSIPLMLFIGAGCPGCKRGESSFAPSDVERTRAPSVRVISDPASVDDQSQKPQSQRTSPSREEDFVKGWNKFNKQSSGDVFEAAIFLQEMSSKGHIDLALKMIYQDFGEGEDRDRLVIHTFLGASGSLSNISDAFLSLDTERDKRAAITGLADNMALRETLDELEDSSLAFLGDRKDQFMESVVRKFAKYSMYVPNAESGGNYVHTLEERRARLNLALSWAESRGNVELEKAIISDYGSDSPFECFEMIGARNLRLSQTEMESLTRRMVDKNPLEAVTKLADSSGRESDLNLAVQLWANRDVSKALQWYSENENSLSPSQSAAVASGFAKQAAGKSNFEAAWKWVEKIEIPESKRKAEGEVWSAERTVVRREATNDPSGTIQTLISGESKHSAYWIEEAMMTWISNEPDKAEEWYQKNWKSLPPAKSQYIAAAYAKEALEAGDIATARQWTNLIQDPKTKDRIATSIDQAQSTQGQ